MVDQDESLALPSDRRRREGLRHAAQASSTVPDKNHFVLLDLKSPDSTHTILISSQIDSVASRNTLSPKHLSNIPWATVIPTTTVVIPYASPPIKSIGKITIEACKGNTTCNLTFQVTD